VSTRNLARGPTVLDRPSDALPRAVGAMGRYDGRRSPDGERP